ncbi:hypothetical protein ES705_47922 [subsurface metagenome]
MIVPSIITLDPFVETLGDAVSVVVVLPLPKVYIWLSYTLSTTK